MSTYIDLHIHSENSDGNLSIQELKQLFNNQNEGKSFFSITDHNYLSENSLNVDRNKYWIPGIEISTQFQGISLHILGYSIKPKIISDLKITLEIIRKGYDRRAKEQYKQLLDLGYNLPKLSTIRNKNLPDPVFKYDIARALIPILKVRDETEAINWCKQHGDILFVEEDNFMPDVETVINQLHDSNFVVFWAHPGTRYLKDGEYHEFLRILKTLKDFGLDGLECFYPSYTKNQTKDFIKYSKDFNLLISGGSDYHGKGRIDDLFMNEECIKYISKTLESIGV